MKKRIIIGIILVIFIMMAIPAVSAVESESVEERLQSREVLREQLEQIIESKPYEPALILRLLLIIRNLLLGISALIIFIIVKIFGNRSAA
jgi:hypothetical protein